MIAETRWCDLCHRKLLTIQEATDNSIGRYRVCNECMDFLKQYAYLVREKKV